ncbi:lipoprotein insertase outer membrane protein LolB [Hahella sp. CR1]|uniref:lipoprotein insertase outer membrane protein LolB n=1 Tax=Hahella sp. CR1 TaxID=2992807 RepID=UPI00244158BB|nr:lipoprotein insertase outer membrane protein LolB [Hahella sp. CR1]MDG9669563.1 lipoprotein insertase outer membrane protein LolB [Hahella sp. CR1]
MSKTFSGGRLFAALLTTLVALSGCQLTPPKETTLNAPGDWSQRKSSLLAFDHWRLQGKLSVRRGDRLDSALINEWNQQGDHFAIHVSSSLLGLGATQIEGSPKGIRLSQPDNEPLFSEHPQQLLERALGWSIPIESLPYWVRGVPDANEANKLTFSVDGELVSIEQNGWLIEYGRFTQVGDLSLPEKITLTSDDARVKLAITEWRP